MRDSDGAVPGFYSLVQACPDRGKAEVANLGVVVFSPARGFLKVKTDIDGDRLGRFFVGEAMLLERLRLASQSLEERLRVEVGRFKTVGDLETFARTRVNDILLTPPRAVRIEDEEATLDRLFTAYVLTRTPKARRSHKLPALDRVCATLERAGRNVWRHRKYEMEDLPSTFECDYGYMNGQPNLITVRRFPEDLTKATQQARLLSADGWRASRHVRIQGSHPHIIVASAETPGDTVSDVENYVIPFFVDCNLEFVRSADIEGLADRIERETGPLTR